MHTAYRYILTSPKWHWICTASGLWVAFYDVY